jgi:hypothetical protein
MAVLRVDLSVRPVYQDERGEFSEDNSKRVGGA